MAKIKLADMLIKEMDSVVLSLKDEREGYRECATLPCMYSGRAEPSRECATLPCMYSGRAEPHKSRAILCDYQN